jgi:hypothetical protein
MNKRKAYLVIGMLIIIFGIIALLGNLNIFPHWDHFLGGALLLSAAGFFFYIYQCNTSRWALLLPCFVLAVLGFGVVFVQFFPAHTDLIGSFLFFSIFAFFVYIFLLDDRYWWTVTLAGFSFSLGTLILVNSFNLVNPGYGGVILLSGVGLTFLYLWGLHRGSLTFRWAIWPAAVFFVLALIVYFDRTEWLGSGVLLSILLILIGGRLVLNTVKSRR